MFLYNSHILKTQGVGILITSLSFNISIKETNNLTHYF